MKSTSILAAVVLVCLLGAFSTTEISAQTIHVSGNVSGVWEADSVIIDATATVAQGDTLVIAAGTYVTGVSLYSEQLVVDTGAVLLVQGTESEPVSFGGYLARIRFLASRGNRLEYCNLTGIFYSGPLTLDSSEVTLVNCNVTPASSDEIALNRRSEITIQNSSIGNVPVNVGLRSTGWFDNCDFQVMGRIRTNDAYYIEVTNCSFVDQYGGREIAAESTDSVYVAHCTFADGGGIEFRTTGYTTVENCLIYGTLGSSNRAIEVFACYRTYLNNLTVIGSEGPGIGTLTMSYSDTVYVTNCIVHDNLGADIDGLNIVINYSCVQDGYTGTGNISDDPTLALSGEHFRLLSTECGDLASSPCIDAGDPNRSDAVMGCDCGGLGTSRSDMGHCGGGFLSTSCCIGTRGNFIPEGSCVNTDQTVDIADLQFLIEYIFITFVPPCCEEEVDVAPFGAPDGNVDIADLQFMIEYLFITFIPPGNC